MANSNNVDAIYVDELHEGSEGSLTVVLCRKWDVISVNKKYISTDYIMSDKKGNVIHCFAKSFIAHRFQKVFQEGCLYTIKGFTVVPNAKKYRVLKDAACMIELQGSTIVRKATDDVEKFNRYPFELSSFEDISPTDNMYFIDVIGYVTHVGSPLLKSSGSQTVEFNLTNERGYQLRVTLWDDLGDVMIEKKNKHPGAYTVILTSMSAKEYLGNMCLSSSSSTLLIDNEDIPLLKSFNDAISNIDVVDTGLPVLEVRSTLETLKHLLDWGRAKRKTESEAFRNKVKITNVRTKNSWFNYTCTFEKCRKGVNPNQKGVFWCDSCKKEVTYPRPRYRLQLDVTDDSADVVVVLFDEIAETLLGQSIQSVLADVEKDETGDAFVMPPVLRNLIGTSHVFEIKSLTYYQVADYESFNCAQVIIEEMVSPSLSKTAASQENHSVVSQSSSSTMLEKEPHMSTMMENKGKKHKIVGCQSETNELDDELVEGTEKPARLRGRKRRIEESDSEVIDGKDEK